MGFAEFPIASTEGHAASRFMPDHVLEVGAGEHLGTGEDDTFQETLKNIESATFAVQKS